MNIPAKKLIFTTLRTNLSTLFSLSLTHIHSFSLALAGTPGGVTVQKLLFHSSDKTVHPIIEPRVTDISELNFNPLKYVFVLVHGVVLLCCVG